MDGLPSEVWRQTKSNLWTDGPILSIDEQTVFWGGRNIPASQLNEKGRRMFGLPDPKVEEVIVKRTELKAKQENGGVKNRVLQLIGIEVR